MVKKAVRSVAHLLHAQVPTTIALCSMCSILTLVEVEVEAQATVMIVDTNTALILQLCWEDVGCPFALAFSFGLAFVPTLGVRLTSSWLSC